MRSLTPRRLPLRLLIWVSLAALPTAAHAQSGVADSVARPTLATAPDRFFTANGQRIRYRDVGHGEPVVMVHGRAGTLIDWQWLADSLVSRYRVITLDQRGHGQSGKPESPDLYGPAMARDVVALLDHLSIPRAHVIGFSLGAVVSAYVAVNFADRVRTVSLLAGPFYPDSATTAQATASFVTDLERGVNPRRPGVSDSAAALQGARRMANSNPAALVAMTRAMANLMIAPQRGPAITVPALVTVGTADELLDNSRWLASWWPGARLVEVPGIGHGGIVRQPAVLQAVREQLRSTP